MSKIVTIYGGDADPRRANEMVVKELEDLLERAYSGEIVGLAAIALAFEGNATTTFCVGTVSSNCFIGALTRLATKLSLDL